MTASSEVFDTAACIQEKLTALGSTTNQIQTAQQDILRLNKEITEAEADVAIARDRVAYIRHPEEHTSFYESWFPINRPMQRENVPYFIAVTVFLVVFSLLVGLSLIGMNINVSMNPALLYFIQRIASQFTWLTLALFFVLVFAIYYFVNQRQS
jgi:sterol desaturase/sphingolipid hydroxylase (fatty acid hydroxylase superfamily)